MRVATLQHYKKKQNNNSEEQHMQKINRYLLKNRPDYTFVDNLFKMEKTGWFQNSPTKTHSQCL